LIYFMIICYILCSLGTFFLVLVSYICQEKSGNPGFLPSPECEPDFFVAIFPKMNHFIKI
jgi:hypothetical protein